jgi:hypothetical protein
LSFSTDGEVATLQMVNLPIIDQPRWPAMDAESTPAFLDFKLVLRAGDERVNYENPMRQYRFEGFKAWAQLEAEVRVPSIDFTFKTEPLETSRADFAVMGTEVNGRYYPESAGKPLTGDRLGASESRKAQYHRLRTPIFETYGGVA